MQTQLEPLSVPELAAAEMRQIAKDLILQAEKLEATVPKRPRRSVEFMFAPQSRRKKQ